MHSFGKTFRVFVSSTFADLKAERDALQRFVFPRLRELCARRGARFQAIDLRWGVSEEAALDHRAMAICLEEIQRCQSLSPRPNFLILLGERYGWRPLPARILATRFAEIHRVCPEPERELLARWYRRDDNAVPAEDVLQPRTKAFADSATWDAIERQLAQTLRRAVEALALAPEERLPYEASATEQEIVAGALAAKDARDHVFGFFRTIAGLPADAAEFRDFSESGAPDREAAERIAQLKQRLRRWLPGNMIDYTAQWQEGTLGDEHLAPLCDEVYGRLSVVIEAALQEEEVREAWEREVEAHMRFAAQRSASFVGRADPLGLLHRYLSGADNHPLLLLGVPGSGKSALIAKALALARGDTADAAIVARFIGATPASTNLRELLLGLCQHIFHSLDYERQKLDRLAALRLENHSEQEAVRRRAAIEAEYRVPEDLAGLRAAFPRFLHMVPEGRRLLIFLDALDQLAEGEDADFAWVPMQLPPRVRLVVSSATETKAAELRRQFPAEGQIVLRGMIASEGEEVLDRWLADLGRTLQPAQRHSVIKCFAIEGLPLYLKLAFEEAQRWPSWREAEDWPFPATISELIRELFSRLAEPANHGARLVERSLALLAASRHGLTEDELLDLLSRDTEVMVEFQDRAQHALPEPRLPVVVWARLFADLQAYLSWREADGTVVLQFFHRQFGRVVAESFLTKREARDRHRSLAAYFASLPAETATAHGITRDLRRLAELPHHLALSGAQAEIFALLTDFDFLEAKCATNISELIEDFDCAAEHWEHLPRWNPAGWFAKDSRPEQLRLLGRAVREEAGVLSVYPALVWQQLYNRLRWDAGVLEEFLESENQKHRTTGAAPWALLRTRPCGVPSPHSAGHSGLITVCHVSPRGTYAVTGSVDRTLRVWELPSGKERLVLTGHGSRITACALSDDGAFIVSGSGDHYTDPTPGKDHSLRKWDAQSGRELGVFVGNFSEILCCALSRDGRWLVSGGGRGGEVLLWATDTLRPVAHFGSDPRKIARAVSMGDTLSAAIVAGAIDVEGAGRMAEAESVELNPGTEGHHRSVVGCAMSADGAHVFTDGDGRLITWNRQSQAKVATCPGTLFLHGNSAAWAASPDGLRLLSTNGSRASLLEIATGRVTDLDSHSDRPITACAFDPAAERIAFGHSDGRIFVRDLAESSAPTMLLGHRAAVRVVAFTPDGCFLVSRAEDRTVRVWELGSGRGLITLPVASEKGVLEVHPFLPLMVGGEADGSFWVAEMIGVKSGPILTTAQAHAHGLTVRCPRCRRSWELQTEALGATMPCGNSDCRLDLKVNRFVLPV
jgi:WD40 repeat protein